MGGGVCVHVWPRRRRLNSSSLLPPPPSSITTNKQGKDDASWGPNNTFRFPLRGGTGTIWKNLYEQIDQSKFRFNAKVVAVDADKKVLTLADGKPSLNY